MARVTVEDCVLKVPNRFELVVLSAQRARHIAAGAPLLVDRDNDKNPVVSLREIADTDIDLEAIKTSVVTGFRHHLPSDDLEEDELSDLFEQETRAFQGAAFASTGLTEKDAEDDLNEEDDESKDFIGGDVDPESDDE